VCFVLFAVLAVAVQLGWAQALDVRLMLEIGQYRPAWATPIMRAASVIGSGAVEIPVGLLLSFRLAMIRRRSEAAGYASAVLSGWALYGLAKYAFQRARPRVIPRLMRGAGCPSSSRTSETIRSFTGRPILISFRSRMSISQ